MIVYFYTFLLIMLILKSKYQEVFETNAFTNMYNILSLIHNISNYCLQVDSN